MKIKRHSFLQGAVILTGSLIIVKIIGAFFRIPLNRIITENGMGYYNTAYSLYFVFYSLSTVGFPTAVAKLVAENYSQGNIKNIVKIKKIATLLFTIVGFLSMAIMVLIARPYTDNIENSLAFLPIITLAPSVFFCSILAIYKGYFQGLSNMTPTATAEVIEALGKLIFGLSTAYFTVDYLGEEYKRFGTVLGKSLHESDAMLQIYSLATTGAVLGISIGSLSACIYISIKYKLSKNQLLSIKSVGEEWSKSALLLRLIKTAIPIGIGAVAISISLFIDSSLLLTRLNAVTRENSNALLDIYMSYLPRENILNTETIPNYLYGCFSFTMAIYMLVPTISQSFAISALPAVTSAWAKANITSIKQNIEAVLRITSLFCLPAGFGLSVLSVPIASLLNGDNEGTLIISKLLVFLGVAAVFSALSIPVNAMLQAINKARLGVINLIIGLTLKIILNYVLCAVPEINVMGAATSTLICYLYICIANMYVLLANVPVKINVYSCIIKPFICTAIAIPATYYLSRYVLQNEVSMSINCIISLLFAVIIYCLSVLITRTLNETDIKMLPNGIKLVKKLRKYKLIT